MIKFSLNRDKKQDYQPTWQQVKQIISKSIIAEYNFVHIFVNIVCEEDSQKINYQYRNIDKPTNVISLEYPETRENFNMLNGDLILCDEVIIKEAKEQGKDILDHYYHMIIHGVMHLQGYDHLTNSEAKVMEDLEIGILKHFNINNPYKE